MADSPLIIKSKEFALQIIKVCNYVKQTKKESVLTNQLKQLKFVKQPVVKKSLFLFTKINFI